jgi:hypothetical protein
LFLALLGMCETNALKAYRHTVGPMERYTWLCKLSKALIDNPFVEADADEAGPSRRPAADGECGNLVYYNHHFKCAACKASTHWKCRCGYPVCRAGNETAKKGKQAPKCDGYYRHIQFGDGA